METTRPMVFLVYLSGGLEWVPPWHRTAPHRYPRRIKLGLHYLHSMLEAQDFDCRIFDQTILPFALPALIAACRQAAPLAIGFYTTFSNRDAVGAALEVFQEQCPDLPLLCGGPGCFEAEFFLNRGCRAVAIGEGEHTLTELLEALSDRRSLTRIQGIAYLDQSGEVVRTPPRPPIADLDSLPFPYLTPELTEIAANQSLIGYGRQMEVITSRGCPFRCSFCSAPRMWGQTVRQRSVSNVMAEIDEGVARCGVRFVLFIDDVFGWDADWLEEFIEAMGRRPDLRFRIIIHPLSFRENPEGVMRRLAEVGLVSFFAGLQTLEPSARRLLRRSAAEAEALVPLLAAARRNGVASEVQYIFGLPGDTLQTYERLLEYSVSVRPNQIGGSHLIVLPGSELASVPGSELRCDLDEAELERAVRRLFARFNRHPRVVANNLRFLIGRAPQISPRAVMRMVGSILGRESRSAVRSSDPGLCRSL